MSYALNCCCQGVSAQHVEVIVPWMGFDPFTPYPYVTAFPGPDITRTKFLRYRVLVDYDVTNPRSGGVPNVAHYSFTYSFTKFGGINKSGTAPNRIPEGDDAGAWVGRVYGPGWAAYDRTTVGSYTSYRTTLTVSRDNILFFETWTPLNELGSSGTVRIEYLLEDEWPYDGINGFYDWAVKLWLRDESFQGSGLNNKKTRRLAILTDGTWSYYPTQAFLDGPDVADGSWVTTYSVMPADIGYYRSYWGIGPAPYNRYPFWWAGRKAKRPGVPISVCLNRELRTPKANAVATFACADWPSTEWHDSAWGGDINSVLLRPTDLVGKIGEENQGNFNQIPSGTTPCSCVANLAP